MVPPKSWLPFGWIDPNLGSKVMIRVGKGFTVQGFKKGTAYLDFLKVERLMLISVKKILFLLLLCHQGEFLYRPNQVCVTLVFFL